MTCAFYKAGKLMTEGYIAARTISVHVFNKTFRLAITIVHSTHGSAENSVQKALSS